MSVDEKLFVRSGIRLWEKWRIIVVLGFRDTKGIDQNTEFPIFYISRKKKIKSMNWMCLTKGTEKWNNTHPNLLAFQLSKFLSLGYNLICKWSCNRCCEQGGRYRELVHYSDPWNVIEWFLILFSVLRKRTQRSKRKK